MCFRSICWNSLYILDNKSNALKQNAGIYGCRMLVITTSSQSAFLHLYQHTLPVYSLCMKMCFVESLKGGSPILILSESPALPTLALIKS